MPNAYAKSNIHTKTAILDRLMQSLTSARDYSSYDGEYEKLLNTCAEAIDEAYQAGWDAGYDQGSESGIWRD